MAAAILHFGDDRCPALPVLRSAGYRVEVSDSIGHLRTRLQTGVEPDAASMTDESGPERQEAVSLLRTTTAVSLILFRSPDGDALPDFDRDPFEAEFDLIVPCWVSSSEWLSEVSDVVEQSRLIQVLSGRMREQSAELRKQSSDLRSNSRRLREESERLIAKGRSADDLFGAEDGRIDSSSSLVGSCDLVLRCVNCHASFVFPAGERQFFREKGLQDPSNCGKCRRKKRGVFELTRVNCSRCGVSTMVPFRPMQGRPVLCRRCFKASHS